MNYYPTYFVTSAALSSNVITLAVEGNLALTDKTAVRLVFAPGVAVPSGSAATDTISLESGGNTLPMSDKFGDDLTLAEMPRTPNGYFRLRSPIVCGIGSTKIIVWNLPIPTEYVIPLRN